MSIRNKLGFINGTLPKPTITDPLYQPWTWCNNLIVAWLLDSLTQPIASTVFYMESAADIWSTLKQNFAQPDDTRVCNLQYTLGNITQGTRLVESYFIELKGIWEELRNFRPRPHCECGRCNADCFKRYTDQYQKDMIFRFLNGLNESFSGVRSQIILMDPIPTLDKVYSLVLREGAQRNPMFQSQPVPESGAMFTSADGKKKVRKDVICSHCGKRGHVKEKCYKIVGFPEDFKFTKGKNNFRKRKAAANSVSVGRDNHVVENQSDQEEESVGTGSMSQLSILKQQVNRLMEILNENGMTSIDAKSTTPSNQQTKHSLVNSTFAG